MLFLPSGGALSLWRVYSTKRENLCLLGCQLGFVANYPTTLWVKTIMFYCLYASEGCLGQLEVSLLRLSHAIVVRCWLGWESLGGPPLTHVSGVWTLMAGTSGNWLSLILGFALTTSYHGRLGRVPGFSHGKWLPQNLYPKRLGESFRLLWSSHGLPGSTSD